MQTSLGSSITYAGFLYSLSPKSLCSKPWVVRWQRKLWRRPFGVGVFRPRQLLHALRPLHWQHQLHPRRRLQPGRRVQRAARTSQVLAKLPSEQDPTCRTIRYVVRLKVHSYSSPQNWICALPPTLATSFNFNEFSNTRERAER